MRLRPTSFAKYYGAHPLHLLTMVAGFALLGYVLIALRPAALWNPDKWWQSVAVWFAAAVVGHDLVLFPLYALADAVLGRLPGNQSESPPRSPKIPVRNYIRFPALGAGLTLLVFLPGIIEQGADTYHAATGLTQQPFLGRWLLVVAVLFAGSALTYAARLILARRRMPEPEKANG
ncbi:hypothetical protein EUA02_02330 [Mycobacterium paragordonae]|jgi:hypothetical protein|uniref:hypothetical protein n=1 Tax=Mycobacterium paragordonae TaxID=1389713 RepID=UPI00105F1B02|nr:hypothetical protein [Mycobacterium paragordonae]TDK98197.1 hypothetical protein EI067_08080 [Mycobacterium paragordonae]TDL02546.1 hypothetical protein EUA02_02330 [Mycobacterium paragordonae]TDL12660.1 hypothetical protein EUA05_00135 [Mycobacterium paragordonae]